MNSINLLQRLVVIDREYADLAIHATGNVDKAIETFRKSIREFELRLRNKLESLVEEDLVFWFNGRIQWRLFVFLVTVVYNIAVSVAITVSNIASANNYVKLSPLNKH